MRWLAKSSGNTCVIARRFSMTYEMPDGVRRLSSSTRKEPASSRTRSIPATWMRTPPGGSRPATDRWKCSELATSRHGTVGQDLPGAVDVGEERLERQHPLAHSRLDPDPLRLVDDPGHEVERER